MKGLAAHCLRFYKAAISPFLPVSCRYVPTCSEYASEAIARHGFLHGSLLGVWRLVRCNPFTHGGYDPVPAIKAAQAEAAEHLDAGQQT